MPSRTQTRVPRGLCRVLSVSNRYLVAGSCRKPRHCRHCLPYGIHTGDLSREFQQREGHSNRARSLHSPEEGRLPAQDGRSFKRLCPSPPSIHGSLQRPREQTSHPCALDRATAESANQAAAHNRRYPVRCGFLLPWSVPPKQEPPLCTEDAGRETCVPARDPPNALLA